ncbi:helix-turn-helix transcriptional regulator [Deinococcus roseus]|uniref:helix-turn-helix transcriptional regulator n=1 Tax=Deinococcus roseus TaxID=392414 RepID=UPI001662DDDE|nr:hypothetical protein [Deinococcus roseus]
MPNSPASRHGAPLSIGQHLTLELQSRQESLQDFSRRLDCPQERLEQVLQGQQPLTVELALRIEKCWGINMKLLLDLQQEHQQWRAHQMDAGSDLTGGP